MSTYMYTTKPNHTANKRKLVFFKIIFIEIFKSSCLYLSVICINIVCVRFRRPVPQEHLLSEASSQAQAGDARLLEVKLEAALLEHGHQAVDYFIIWWKYKRF